MQLKGTLVTRVGYFKFRFFKRATEATLLNSSAPIMLMSAPVSTTPWVGTLVPGQTLAWVCYLYLSLAPVLLHCPRLMMSVGTVEGHHFPPDSGTEQNGFDHPLACSQV